jgi:hypothetical protein
MLQDYGLNFKPHLYLGQSEYDIFIASILYSRKICLEYPLLVIGSTPKSGIYLRISLSYQTFAFPKYSARISLSPVQLIYQKL